MSSVSRAQCRNLKFILAIFRVGCNWKFLAYAQLRNLMKTTWFAYPTWWHYRQSCRLATFFRFILFLKKSFWRYLFLITLNIIFKESVFSYLQVKLVATIIITFCVVFYYLSQCLWYLNKRRVKKTLLVSLAIFNEFMQFNNYSQHSSPLIPSFPLSPVKVIMQ